MMVPKSLYSSLLPLLFGACSFVASAQSPAASKAVVPATHPGIPALFLSDIHLDPYHDPAKILKLNTASAADWPAILAAPDAPS